MSRIQLKRTANTGFTPDANLLSLGELLLSYNDGFLYFADQNGNIYQIGAQLVPYSIQSINVNGTMLTATQGNTTITLLPGDASLNIVGNNGGNNIITLTANVAFIAGPAYAQANAANALAQSAYTQANIALTTAQNAPFLNLTSSITFSNTNVGGLIWCNVSGAGILTISINTNSNVPVPIGGGEPTFVLVTGQGRTGNTVIVPLSGVTLKTANSTLSGNCNVAPNIVCRIYHVDANTWFAERS